MNSNQVRKNKPVLFTDEKINKPQQYHILMSNQD